MRTRFSLLENVTNAAALLGVSVDPVLRRAGLALEALNADATTASPELHFRVWTALRDEAAREDFEFVLARAFANGPFAAPVFAFSCAETLAQGFERLCDFKPLMGPKRLLLDRPGGDLEVTVLPVEGGAPIPASWGLFEALYLTELARICTGETITPLSVTLTEALPLTDEARAQLGGAPVVADRCSLRISARDAARPLLTRSAAVWSQIEPLLRAELAETEARSSVAKQVRAILIEALPGGMSTADDVARRLNLSKRSLQRRLSEEGTSFQAVLGQTRAELSARYLRDSDMSLPEISFLLGFSDTSSFHRAFHGWKGVTPGEFRLGQDECSAA